MESPRGVHLICKSKHDLYEKVYVDLVELRAHGGYGL
jgi:hypothetical protein